MSSLIPSIEVGQAPRTRKRAFQYPALPLPPNLERYTDAGSLVDDIQRYGEAMVNWGRGNQAYAIQLNEIINAGIGLNFFTTVNGYSAEFELPETPENDALVNAAISRANAIIQRTYNMQGFTLATTPPITAGSSALDNARSTSQSLSGFHYATPPKPEDATAPGAAKMNEQAVGISAPTPAPRPRGRPKGSGGRGVSLILSLPMRLSDKVSSIPNANMRVSQGKAMDAKVARPKKTANTPAKTGTATAPRKCAPWRKAVSAEVVAEGETGGGVQLREADAGEPSGAGLSSNGNGKGNGMGIGMGADTVNEMAIDASAEEAKYETAAMVEEPDSNSMRAFETALVAELENAVDTSLPPTDEGHLFCSVSS